MPYPLMQYKLYYLLSSLRHGDSAAHYKKFHLSPLILFFLILSHCSISSAATIKPLKLLTGHNSWVNGIALFGNSLYSVSNDGSLIEWELSSGKPIKQFFLDKIIMPAREVIPNIYTISINDSGSLYATTSSDGYLRIRNRKTHEELWNYRIKMENAYAIKFVGNRTILIGDISGTVTLIDLEKKIELYEIDAHIDAINELAISPDRKSFVTVSNDSLVRLWEIKTGKHIGTLKGHKDSILSVDYSPDGRKLITGSRDRTVRLWKLDDGSSEVIHNDFSYVNEVAFSPDGRQVAYQDHMQNVTIKDLEYEKVLFELKGHKANVKRILFSSDSSKVYTCGSDSNIIIWNIKEEK